MSAARLSKGSLRIIPFLVEGARIEDRKAGRGHLVRPGGYQIRTVELRAIQIMLDEQVIQVLTDTPSTTTYVLHDSRKPTRH